MANNCYYQMKVVADDKATLERLEKIMLYEDPEYYIYRVFSVDMDQITEQDGRYITQYMGDVAWACHSWIDDEPSDDVSKTGAHYTTLTELSRILGFSFELFAEECGCCFNEHFQVSHGIIKVNDCTDWFDNFYESIDDLDDSLRDWVDDKIISEKDAEDIRRQAEGLFEKNCDVTVQVGGFAWDFGSADEIENGVLKSNYGTYEVYT